MIADLRTMIGTQIRAMVGSGDVDLSRPDGDDGLFGPGTTTWAVHGDFSAMMIGGISALLLQMLHPRALAGVWDHSDFRRDRLGRLRRTAQFIATTTFGSTATANAAIDRVRNIHHHVVGTLPDGTSYSADDPDLLTWIHVAEVDSFLRSYIRYRAPGLPAAAQDRYLAEVALIAHRLGASDVPDSRRAIDAYYRRVRRELRYDARVREVSAALLARGDDRKTAPAMALLTAAGVDLLPDWAAAMHGRTLPTIGRPLVRAGANGMSRVLRWSLARR